jgi:succinate dehydrogenase flavin-adding protein (antitoxin of CptAB toxin-antitoxin module)
VLIPLAIQWTTLFVARDTDLDMSNLTQAEFDWLAHQGKQRYSSIINTEDLDLSPFFTAGGKLITYQGLVCL